MFPIFYVRSRTSTTYMSNRKYIVSLDFVPIYESPGTVCVYRIFKASETVFGSGVAF